MRCSRWDWPPGCAPARPGWERFWSRRLLPGSWPGGAARERVLPWSFTAGLALYAAAPPVVAHAMLAYPDGRVRWRPGRAGLALAYAGAVLCARHPGRRGFRSRRRGLCPVPAQPAARRWRQRHVPEPQPGRHVPGSGLLAAAHPARRGRSHPVGARWPAPGCSRGGCGLRLPGPRRRGLRAQPGPRLPRRRSARPLALAWPGGRALRALAGCHLGLGCGPGGRAPRSPGS